MISGVSRRAVWLALATLFISSAAGGEEPLAHRKAPAVLSVQISVPTAWLLLGDEQMSDTLSERVRQMLRQSGCDFPIKMLGLADNPADAPYLLTIELSEWRLDALGYAHSSFTARLKTPKETRDFGVYSSATMKWAFDMPPFRLSSAFEYAAEDAVKQLGADIGRTGLLADLQSRT